MKYVNKCALYLLITYSIMWLIPFVKQQTQGIIVGLTGILVVVFMLTSKPNCDEKQEDGGLPRKNTE